MSDERVKDAKTLIDGGRWEFGFYAAGYAVECALKACVLARMVHTGWVFDQTNIKVDECRTHNFTKLIQIAGLGDELIARLKASALASDGFAPNWNTAKAWDVSTRYEPKSEAEARAIYSAITDEPDGVLTWIRNYW
jgi:hypothetical protein